MDFLKELFKEPLSFEAFQKAVEEKGIKLANLSAGKHVDKDKLEKALGDLKTANNTIATMTAELEGLKDSKASAEEWEKKFNDLQSDIAEKEKAAKEAAEKAEKDANILNRFKTVSVDKDGKPLEWVNEFTEKGFLSLFTEAIENKDNSSKSDADIFSALTKDAVSAFKTTQPIVQLKGAGGLNPGTDELAQAKAVMGIE